MDAIKFCDFFRSSIHMGQRERRKKVFLQNKNLQFDSSDFVDEDICHMKFTTHNSMSPINPKSSAAVLASKGSDHARQSNVYSSWFKSPFSFIFNDLM